MDMNESVQFKKKKHERVCMHHLARFFRHQEEGGGWLMALSWAAVVRAEASELVQRTMDYAKNSLELGVERRYFR